MPLCAFRNTPFYFEAVTCNFSQESLTEDKIKVRELIK